MTDPSLEEEAIREGGKVARVFLPWIFREATHKIKEIIRDKIKKEPPEKPRMSPPSISTGKILSIGGGEIAVEINLAAIQSSWNVYAIDERGEDAPMKKFGEMTGIGSLDVYEEIESLSLPYEVSQRDATMLLEGAIVNRVKPDFVVLEKNFIPLENWKSLQTIVRRHPDIRYRRPITFIPDLETADFFINKIKTKEKLEQVLGEKLSEEHLINYIVIDLEEDKEVQVEDIKNFLKMHKKAILKPPITESGKGQSELESEDDISDALYKLHRAEVKQQKKAILEEKKEVTSEVFYALFRPVCDLGITPKQIGPIQFKKQSLEFGGPVRLTESRYPPKDIPLEAERRMKDINNRIAKDIKVPYLGIEYFLCNDNNVYINELVWRPEDVGFVTLLSHTKNQFELFMDCLEKERIEEPNVKDGNFLCITLIRDKNFEIFPVDPKISEEDWIVHFYHKDFSLPSKRIIGYAVGNLKREFVTTPDNFKTFLKEEILSEEFGEKEVNKFYF